MNLLYRTLRILPPLAVVTAFIVFGIRWGYIDLPGSKDLPAPHAQIIPTTSAELTETTFVPTLESPIPDDTSAIWCTTLGCMWRALVDEFYECQIVIEGSEDICRRLASHPPMDDHLLPSEYFTCASRSADKLSKAVKHKAKKLGIEPESMTLWEETQHIPPGFGAYSWLNIDFSFPIPFHEFKRPYEFVGANGHRKQVHTFGIIRTNPRCMQMFAQIDIVYVSPPTEEGMHTYVVDLSKTHERFETLISTLPRRESIAGTIALMDSLIASDGNAACRVQIDESSSLIVPVMCWDITHRFSELEWKNTWCGAQPVLPLIYVGQRIKFSLNHTGVLLRSEARGIPLCISISPHISVLKPFMLLIRTRDRKVPVLAMWVDNPELLQEWDPQRIESLRGRFGL